MPLNMDLRSMVVLWCSWLCGVPNLALANFVFQRSRIIHPKGNFHDLDSCVKVSILFKCSSEGTVTGKDMLKPVTRHWEIFGEATGTILTTRVFTLVYTGVQKQRLRGVLGVCSPVKSLWKKPLLQCLFKMCVKHFKDLHIYLLKCNKVT